jgi:hypothetical protein
MNKLGNMINRQSLMVLAQARTVAIYNDVARQPKPKQLIQK